MHGNPLFLPYYLVLGLDFLQRFQANICFSGPEETHVACPIRARAAFTIKPNSEFTVTANVMTLDDLTGAVGVTDSYPVNPQSVTKRALVTPVKLTDNCNTVPVTLLNPFDWEIDVPKHSMLGMFQLSSEENYIPVPGGG